MFKKTKRNIVFAIVLSLLIMMTVTLSVIFISNRIALRRENATMLEQYVLQFSLDAQPTSAEPADKPSYKPERKPDAQDESDPSVSPEPKKREKNEPAFRLSTFYSVAYAPDGEALRVHNGNSELHSEEDILELTSSVLTGGRQSGSVGSMMYLVSQRDDYTLVAMMDNTITDNSQKTLIRQMLLFGSIAMAVLFVMSIFIARRIIRPLEENDRRQKQFVSDAGHELKTPIAVISTNSELLQREIGENEWLSNITYENEKMSTLVKQLLLLSYSEHDDQSKETIDISALVGGEVLPFESYAFEKGFEIVSEITPDLPVRGNAHQLRQLVSILLDNAVAHGTSGQILLDLHAEKHFAKLTVSNPAEVIGTEQVQYLFDRFYRTDEARTDADAHYGLGLSIAKAVVDTHGGEIHADYQNGRMTFTVTLPIR